MAGYNGGDRGRTKRGTTENKGEISPCRICKGWGCIDAWFEAGMFGIEVKGGIDIVHHVADNEKRKLDTLNALTSAPAVLFADLSDMDEIKNLALQANEWGDAAATYVKF